MNVRAVNTRAMPSCRRSAKAWREARMLLAAGVVILFIARAYASAANDEHLSDTGRFYLFFDAGHAFPTGGRHFAGNAPPEADLIVAKNTRIDVPTFNAIIGGGV